MTSKTKSTSRKFDTWLDEERKDPEFDRMYSKARAEIAAIDKIANRNEPALQALESLLKGGRLLTVAQIMIETGCSKPVAHKRIRALRARGCAFQTAQIREGASGPKATAYAIVVEENGENVEIVVDTCYNEE